MPPRRKTAKTSTGKKRSRVAAKPPRPPRTLTSLSAETLLRVAKLLAGSPLDVYHLMLTCKTCLEPARGALPVNPGLAMQANRPVESDEEEDDSEEFSEKEDNEDVCSSDDEADEPAEYRRRPRWRMRPVEHDEEEEERQYEARQRWQEKWQRAQRRAWNKANGVPPARRQLLEAARAMNPDIAFSSDEDKDETEDEDEESGLEEEE